MSTTSGWIPRGCTAAFLSLGVLSLLGCAPDAVGINGAPQAAVATVDSPIRPAIVTSDVSSAGDGIKTIAASSGSWSVAAGTYHSLAKRPDGTVWVWGLNTYGQHGVGDTTTRNMPVRISGLPTIQAVDAANNQSFAISTAGEVWAWGANSSGQLGIGDVSGTTTPVRLDAFAPTTSVKIAAIAAGSGHVLALSTSGEIWAWGRNDSGQLGIGNTLTKKKPEKIPGLSTAIAIAAGMDHSLALLADGTVFAWGSNTFGQVGNGGGPCPCDRILDPTPVLIDIVGAAPLAIVAGGNHSLVLMDDNSVWGWGRNNEGQLGQGFTSLSESDPLEITGLGPVAAISAGGTHSLARTSDGKIWAWGNNSQGQLGDGTTTRRDVPVAVSIRAGAIGLVGGQYHSLAVEPNCPAVSGWGSNGFGQLGIGTSGSKSTIPVQTKLYKTFFADSDGDGFGDKAVSEEKCMPSAGYVDNSADCDDRAATTFPGAAERCDGKDNNCNGVIDEGNPESGRDCTTGKPGICGAGKTSCSGGSLGCNQQVFPSAETCDGKDNNCDGSIDEGNPGGTMSCNTGKLGVCSAGVTWCQSGSIQCVPKNAASVEVCDGLDNDCNGATDEGFSFLTYYKDADGDGWGSSTGSISSCKDLSSYVTKGGDCHDTNSSVYPGATEICNGVDDNCNGSVDEGVLVTYYQDYDGDGWGNSSISYVACVKPTGYVSTKGDCNDKNSRINPGSTEICNNIDDDCDGVIDGEDAGCICSPGASRFCGPDQYTWHCAELCPEPPIFPGGTFLTSSLLTPESRPIGQTRPPICDGLPAPGCLFPQKACKQYLVTTCDATGRSWGPCH